jgi:KipI family sensor histidine kinase inhibitor
MMAPMQDDTPRGENPGEPRGARPSLVEASDRSLLVVLGDRSDAGTHARVRRLLLRLDAAPPGGVVDLSPAYASILVRFDPLRTDHAALRAALAARLDDLDREPLPEPRLVTLPVCYGGEFGPDLDDVARHASISPDDAVALHASVTYEVHFLGFTPGFAYMGTVPEAIACPRLDRPRRVVPAGSVGIAGAQTGVYPCPTPGGWRLIGRTPAVMFDAAATPMSRLQIGDRVRFEPIPAAAFRGATA